CLQVLEFPWTF
nr:immunoglobulin light chain junction region [Macaca mulatta]